MISDPDYARFFSKARCIAWSYGWNLIVHGTMTRDLDLVMVPWTEEAREPTAVLAHMTSATDTIFSHEPGQKPHGRVAYTLRFKDGFGDPRWIDLSVMPLRPKELQ